MPTARFLRKVLLLTSDGIGRGDEKLGQMVLTHLLENIAADEEKPDVLFLVNSGVKLAVRDTQIDDLLTKMEKEGIRVFACTTCLRHFNLETRVEPHRASSVRKLVELMKTHEVISL